MQRISGNRRKALTNEILEKSYDEIISSRGLDGRQGRVNMDELFKHIRKNHITKLTIVKFKEFMKEFYEKYPLGNYFFERASGTRWVRKYGFYIAKKPAGIYFYMHKGI